MEILFSIILSYLIGSISFSYLITKKIKKIDIREHGSGNAGATNTLRVLGPWAAATVLILDMLKGVAAVLIALSLAGPGLVPALAGLATILGHNWPIYHGFRGGKGVATTIGVMVTIAFIPSVISGVITIAIIAITRLVSLGSLIFMIATTALIFFLLERFQYSEYYLYLSIVVTILSFWRHRANISRLLQGKENKLGAK